MNERAGKYVKNFSGESEYLSFYPRPLPPEPKIETDAKLRDLLIDAHSKLALLSGLSDRIPNKDLFVSMCVRKEALVSSQIEGTRCTLEDVLDPGIDENVNADVSDVVNCVRAINYAAERLVESPLCNRLIRETHAVLMNSVRGSDKTPGEFRTSQNWIGGAGSALKNARFNKRDPLCYNYICKNTASEKMMKSEYPQKIKLLKLIDFLQRETDEERPVSRQDLCEKLNSSGIPSNPRTLSLDISLLNDSGYEIMLLREGRQVFCYVDDRTFSIR